MLRTLRIPKQYQKSSITEISQYQNFHVFFIRVSLIFGNPAILLATQQHLINVSANASSNVRANVSLSTQTT